MTKLRDEFQENIDYFLQESKNEYSRIVQKKNEKYRDLLEKLHKFLNDLIKDKKDKDKLEDEFFDCFYELMYIESMFLYKQGYKNCFRILRMLDKD